MVIGFSLNLISTESELYFLITFKINLLLMIVGVALLIYSNIKTYKEIKAKRSEKLADLEKTIKLESNQLN